MATTISRIPASFRFQSTLMDELKSKAKASNRSLNNYVESLLLGILHPEKNKNNEISPDLQVVIDKVKDEHKRGEFVRCGSKKELQTFLDSL